MSYLICIHVRKIWETRLTTVDTAIYPLSCSKCQIAIVKNMLQFMHWKVHPFGKIFPIKGNQVITNLLELFQC